MSAVIESADEVAARTLLASLVGRYARGDATVLLELTPRLYDELRRIARVQIRQESSAHALLATALVHEAYLRLTN